MASSNFSGPVTRQTGRISYEAGSIIRKCGSSFRIKREIEAITFVRSHTTIPIPEILDYQVDSNNSWFLMKRLRASRPTPVNSWTDWILLRRIRL